jgi:hypothetical protein
LSRLSATPILTFLPGSDKLDQEKPISCGFYRLEKGTPLVYSYTYHEMKIIVEGEVEISDETGQKVHAHAGDVFYFPKGSKITFNTPNHCLAFYVSLGSPSALLSTLANAPDCRLAKGKKEEHNRGMMFKGIPATWVTYGRHSMACRISGQRGATARRTA